MPHRDLKKHKKVYSNLWGFACPKGLERIVETLFSEQYGLS